MGFILSKFRRKKPCTKDQLESIDKELRNIQRFQVDTELQQKKIIGRLIIVSSVGYLIAAAAFYFLAPRGRPWSDQLKFILPFVIFPFLIWGLKRFMAWYYEQKIVRKKERYAELKKEKQRILEDVMDNETFKVGKEILEKYAPSQLIPKHLTEQFSHLQSMSTLSPMSTPQQQRQMVAMRTPTTAGFNEGLRRRQQQGRPSIPSGMSTPLRQPQPGASVPQTPAPAYMLPLPPANPVVHNRSMGWMDKLVEYVVGDGPNSRYALICRYCATHNGLATQEEFPYLGFRCAYCKQFNPPRQVRPAAPKLPTNTVLIEELESTIKTDKSESQIVTHESDSETENKEKASSQPNRPQESDGGSDAEMNKAQELLESENEIICQSGVEEIVTPSEEEVQEQNIESMEVDDIKEAGSHPEGEEVGTVIDSRNQGIRKA
ncbi:unnamed protein product [Allacma fusca]|uniref:Endoplasmic reticulum junction formation protein lunapark n=1 Tax=Allacma fusca TaxID=39272 RepID=A0A8J2PJW1_9HEXA|nr:unnamed protein product [Allacma fusca]